MSPEESFMMDDACLKLYQLSENLNKYSGTELLGTVYSNSFGTGHQDYMYCEKGCMAYMGESLLPDDSESDFEDETLLKSKRKLVPFAMHNFCEAHMHLPD